MHILKTIQALCRNPYHLFVAMAGHGLLNWVNDATYLKLQYRAIVGKKLPLDSPQTFNEKIQWLKLHDRRPEYTIMVDKFNVREYVANTVGEYYLIPLVGGPWRTFDEIDFSALPDRFVLKCTHDSGGIIICDSKVAMDMMAARRKMEAHLRHNYFWQGREWPYRNVQPQIIAEKYLEDDYGNDIKDYKIFCFDGLPRVIQVDFDRFTNHRRNVYSTSWEYLGFTSLYPTAPEIKIPKPARLGEMVEVAARLAKGLPHVRVDMYVIRDHVYFGELTLHHGSGFEVYSPEEWDTRLGSWLHLPGEVR